METKFLCLNHAKETVHLLFVGQRMVIDTNIRLETKNHHCEYIHPLTPRISCDFIAAVKVMIFPRNENFAVLQDSTKVRSVKPRKQSKLS